VKVGGGYDLEGLKYYWQCKNDGTGFEFTTLPEGCNSISNAMFTPRPDITCWGEVARAMGQEVVQCKECGQPGELDWTAPYPDLMRQKQVCFSCLGWVEKLEAIERGKMYYITNKYDCYTLGPEPAENSWKNHKGDLGFGGARYEFELHGDIVHHIVSHNVWYGGIVPEHFRDRLPTNCTIIPRAGNDWGW
jgi:hypothetical protein